MKHQTIIIFLAYPLLTQGQFQLQPDNAPKCTRPGFMCRDCTSRVVCVRQQEEFTEYQVENCTKPFKCVNGQCTTRQDPICDGWGEIPFVCNNVGAFPDPFYCKKFVICRKDFGKYSASKHDCEYGYGYKARTNSCDKPLVHNTCPKDVYPIPLCRKAGEVRALREDPAIYYECKSLNEPETVLYPVQYMCPKGQLYNEFNRRCECLQFWNENRKRLSNVQPFKQEDQPTFRSFLNQMFPTSGRETGTTTNRIPHAQ